MALLKLLFATLLLQAAAPPPPATAIIEGRVASTSGTFLSKATVSLFGPAASMQAEPTSVAQPGNTVVNVMTDADGRFRFDALRPGTYRLRVDRTGFVGVEYGQKHPDGTGELLTMTPGQHLHDLALTLVPQGAIGGHIVDENGAPVRRALVQALKYSYQGLTPGRSLVVVASVTTDDLGAYRLFWLAPGPYIVAASLNSSISMAVTSNGLLRVTVRSSNEVTVKATPYSDGTVDEESAVQVYYPGTTAPNEAAPVVVRAGETVDGIDIASRSAPVYRIRGVTINGATGQPESMTVTLYPEGAGIVPVGAPHYSTESGVFEIIGVPSGAYMLLGQSDALIGAMPVNVGNTDVAGVVLNTSASTFTLDGRVSREGAAPEDKTSSRAPFPATILRLSNIHFPALSPPPVSLGTETFVLRSIWPGDYTVLVEDRDSKSYLKSVRLGNQDGMGILHLQGRPEAPMDIVLSSVKGSVDGRIVDARGNAAVNATVVMIPDPPYRSRSEMYFTPAVDGSGKFHISAMPGSYKLFAWENVEKEEWSDPDFIRKYENRGRPLDVRDGSREDVEFSVIPDAP